MSVREMAAVRQIHRQNLVAGFQHREVNGHVCLRTAVRLHVDVFAAEKPLGAIDRQLFGGIDVFAAAIPSFQRIKSCSAVSTFSQPPYQRFRG